MQLPTNAELIPIIQLSVGPAILISGVGLLLLTMVNRFNHVADRARALSGEYNKHPHDVLPHKRAQMVILWNRARLMRLAIGSASAGGLFAALLIIVMFVSALHRIEDAWLIGFLFVATVSAIIMSMALFLIDVNRTLAALRLDLFGSADGCGGAAGQENTGRKNP